MDAAFLPTDVEVALSCLQGDCPPGARLISGMVPCFPLHSMYAVLHEATEANHELEELRLSSGVRILTCATAHGEEKMLVPASEFTMAMRQVDGHAEEAGTSVDHEALAKCTGLQLGRAELQAALGHATQDDVSRVAGALVQQGWLMLPHSRQTGADEAPPDSQDWMWSMPGVGRLLSSLLRCRTEVLRVLWKQKFHRAMRHVVEGSPGVRKALAAANLDLRYVQRDLVGKRLLEQVDTRAGTVLQLTPAGQQLANHHAHTSGRKRRR